MLLYLHNLANLDIFDIILSTLPVKSWSIPYQIVNATKFHNPSAGVGSKLQLNQSIFYAQINSHTT